MNLINDDIEEARGFLNRAEKELDPALKGEYYEAGFDLLKEIQKDSAVDQYSINKVKAIRLAYTRSLLSQVNIIKAADTEVWVKYFLHLIVELKDEIKEVIKTNPEFRNKLLDFFNIVGKASMEEIEAFLQ